MAALTTAPDCTPHAWRVWVSDEEVHHSRTAWVRARDGGAPADRVRDLLEEFERLSRTAVLQAAEDPWPGDHELRAVTVAATLRAVRRPDPVFALPAAG